MICRRILSGSLWKSPPGITGESIDAILACSVILIQKGKSCRKVGSGVGILKAIDLFKDNPDRLTQL